MDFTQRLDELERRYDAVAAEMSSPEVASVPERLRSLGKDLADLQDDLLEPAEV
jgi:protein subunit release factor A